MAETNNVHRAFLGALNSLEKLGDAIDVNFNLSNKNQLHFSIDLVATTSQPPYTLPPYTFPPLPTPTSTPTPTFTLPIPTFPIPTFSPTPTPSPTPTFTLPIPTFPISTSSLLPNSLPVATLPVPFPSLTPFPIPSPTPTPSPTPFPIPTNIPPTPYAVVKVGIDSTAGVPVNTPSGSGARLLRDKNTALGTRQQIADSLTRVVDAWLANVQGSSSLEIGVGNKSSQTNSVAILPGGNGTSGGAISN